jgi:transposase
MGHMRKSRLSQHKQGRLIEHFVAGTTARTAASLCGVHRNTAAYYFLRLREIIAYELEADSEAMFGVRLKLTRAISAASAKLIYLAVIISAKRGICLSLFIWFCEFY